MANKFVDHAGPWASSETVQEYLHIDSDELARLLANHEILGCSFSDRKTYFPLRGFLDGRLVDGLGEVLAVLASGPTNAQTWATWLAGSPRDDGVSHWEHLRAGRLDEVLLEARRDVARWNQ